MAKKIIMIPFDKDGNLMQWVSHNDHTRPPSGHWVDDITEPRGRRFVPAGEWRINYEFNDVLQIEGIHRGRSAARFRLRGSNGCKYEMFMTDMDDVILNADIHKGLIAGTWTFQKRGANYGIRLVKGKE